jgi:hypothetical protein
MLNFIRSSLLLALAVSFAACAADPTDDTETDDVAVDAKADSSAAKPSGHYVALSGVHAGDLTDLVLNADHTFTRNVFVYCTTPQYPLDCGHQSGTYKFTKSTTSSTRYIRFLDADGDLMDRFAYVVKADSSLALRADDDTRWFTLVPHQFDPRQ